MRIAGTIWHEDGPGGILALRQTLRLARGEMTPFHRDEDLAPFFIVGAPRSGNTLLRRMLTAHPGVHIPPESYVLRRVF